MLRLTVKGLAALTQVLAVTSALAIDAGESLYGQHCATCHGASFRGSAHGATFVGPGFLEKWSAKSARALLDY